MRTYEMAHEMTRGVDVKICIQARGSLKIYLPRFSQKTQVIL